jgi:hypothetical protein
VTKEPAKFKEVDVVEKYDKASIAKPEQTLAPNTKKTILSNNQPNAIKFQRGSKSPVAKTEVSTLSPQVLKVYTIKPLFSSEEENTVKIEPKAIAQPREEPLQKTLRITKKQSGLEKSSIFKKEKTEQEIQAMNRNPQGSTLKSPENTQKEASKTEKPISKSPSIVTEISPPPWIPIKGQTDKQRELAEPTVTIHIGRIEVHAALPQKPIIRSCMPVLSLKEYLKQREGGK